MKRCAGAILLVASAHIAGPAHASSLPPIKSSDKNPVAACATPGRLMAYLKSRNGELADRFDGIATEYMRLGEELGLRWDYAFFQMIVETGSLSFKRNGGSGDVKPKQNNFAGLGATGNGEPGESFPDVSTGVKAHLQHVLMYSGERVDGPVAERTRKVQEWGVLTSWQKGLKGPITFTDLTRKWSPKDGTYAGSIESVANRFFSDFCNMPDPRPELVADARKGRATGTASAKEAPAAKVSGKALAQKAQERARAEGDGARFSLGAKAVARAAAEGLDPAPRQTAAIDTPVTLINPGKPGAPDASQPAATAKGSNPAQTTFQTAAAGGLAKPAAPTSKCRVWTASYGGQKAIIIKAVSDQVVNYTVLDVNDGAERREADAFISAYAKGGQQVGEFASQSQALDKAFELCPEG
jgi:hypothetical protein